MKKPKFSGLPKDVAQFVRDWTEVETIIHSSSNIPVTDFAILMELRGCLDEASAETLKSRMTLEKELRYQEYWDSFRQEWGVDAQKQNRADWFSVKLNFSGPSDAPVTMGDWRKFQAQFVTARGRVSDRTFAEEHQLIFRQLTPKMQEALVREQAKRRVSRPWVSISLHENARLVEVLEGIQEAYGGTLPAHFSTKTGCVFKCTTTAERDKLLRFNDWEFDGRATQTTRFDYEMSGDEIFEFFLNRLKERQELQAMQQSYGCTPSNSSSALANTATPTPKATVTVVDKGTVKGTPSTNTVAGQGSSAAVSSSSAEPGKSSKTISRKQRDRAKIAALEAQLQSRAFEKPVQRPQSPRSAAQERPSPRSPRDRTYPTRQGAGQQPPRHNGVQLNRDECWSCAKKGIKETKHDFRTCENYLGAEASKVLRAVMAAQKMEKEKRASSPATAGSASK
jgi:hypothetical protein